jgi:hypothetical protein
MLIYMQQNYQVTRSIIYLKGYCTGIFTYMIRITTLLRRVGGRNIYCPLMV